MKISSDAAKCGLGAVILQQHDGEWHPVAYASRAMASAETRYAQIEKELLSIMFACELFHQFIYGQTLIVETDHKPLVNLFHKSLNDCPLRIQTHDQTPEVLTESILHNREMYAHCRCIVQGDRSHRSSILNGRRCTSVCQHGDIKHASLE